MNHKLAGEVMVRNIYCIDQSNFAKNVCIFVGNCTIF
jgi:hypothetical protein